VASTMRNGVNQRRASFEQPCRAASHNLRQIVCIVMLAAPSVTVKITAGLNGPGDDNFGYINSESAQAQRAGHKNVREFPTP
jgi:hypothetical protein